MNTDFFYFTQNRCWRLIFYIARSYILSLFDFLTLHSLVKLCKVASLFNEFLKISLLSFYGRLLKLSYLR